MSVCGDSGSAELAFDGSLLQIELLPPVAEVEEVHGMDDLQHLTLDSCFAGDLHQAARPWEAPVDDSDLPGLFVGEVEGIASLGRRVAPVGDGMAGHRNLTRIVRKRESAKKEAEADKPAQPMPSDPASVPLGGGCRTVLGQIARVGAPEPPA
jgi:hypothetical protein